MKIFNGIIVSVGVNNTVSVSVERKVPHPLYGKLIKKNKKYLTDAAGFELVIGDKVEIVETKPVSKNKYFKILKVVGKKTLVKKTEVAEKELNEEKSEKKKVSVSKAAKPAVTKVKPVKKETK